MSQRSEVMYGDWESVLARVCALQCFAAIKPNQAHLPNMQCTRQQAYVANRTHHS